MVPVSRALQIWIHSTMFLARKTSDNEDGDVGVPMGAPPVLCSSPRTQLITDINAIIGDH
jgi:hypothetical protein